MAPGSNQQTWFAINCKMYRIEDWRLKILRKTSSIQVWIEDWRFSEKLLQSRSGLKIEDSQKNFFNPGLDWRLKILRKTSSIQVWIEDWRFLEKLFNPGLASHLQCRVQKAGKIDDTISKKGKRENIWENWNTFNKVKNTTKLRIKT